MNDIEEDISLEKLEQSFKSSAATTAVGMDGAGIIQSLHHSAEFFIQFFLGEELTFDIPEFHISAWEYLTQDSVNRIALALPRGHAKTTLAKLAVIWYFLFTNVRFIVYVSDTATIAAEACQDIINFMECVNYKSVFGDLEFDVRQDGRGFYKFTMRMIDTKGEMKEKFCILRSFGAGQQVRGMNIDNKRPELAIVDDLENDENTATKAAIKKLRIWFYGSFYKALANVSKLIYLGNMLSSDSLLYHFCEKSDLWHSLRYGCLMSDGAPLWPEMWPIEKIKADFLEYQILGLIGRWFAEMMNMPIPDGNLLINSEDIYYVPVMNPDEQDLAFITIDCAISEKTWADDTAITVHACKNGLWRVVEYTSGKYNPNQVFWLLVELCKKWRCRVLGIQQTAFEKAYKFVFEVLMTVHNQHFEICALPHDNKSKFSRLAAWCSVMRDKQWAIQEGEYSITEQLLRFDPAKENNDDDLIDACSMGVTMTDYYMTQIVENQVAMPELYETISSYDVCKI